VKDEIDNLVHLKIMGEKGAKRAMESLEMILDMDVDMTISAVNMVSPYSIPDIVGSQEVVSLFSHYSGTLSGTMFCLLSQHGTLELASALLGDPTDEGSDMIFDEITESATIEIGNIITSSFVDIWADTFSIELSHDVPVLNYDFADAIIDSALIDVAKGGDSVIIFNSTLNIFNMDINFNILMLPDPGDLKTVFDMFEDN